MGGRLRRVVKGLGVLAFRVRRSLLVFVCLALLAPLLTVSPVGALNEDEIVRVDVEGSQSLQREIGPGERPVGEPLSDVAALDAAPVVGVVSGPGSARVDVDPPAVEVSSEAERQGWKPTGIEIARVQVARDVRVADAPVRVELPANAANRRLEPSARVRVLDESLSGQLSAFDSVVALDWADPDGLVVSPRGGFALSFDLSDVNLGASPDIGERLSITAFRDCGLFDVDPADLDLEVGEDVNVEALPPEVVCGGIEKLDADFDAETRVLSVQVDEEAIDKAIAERRVALEREGFQAEVIDPQFGRVPATGVRSIGLGLTEVLLDAGVRSQSTDAVGVGDTEQGSTDVDVVGVDEATGDVADADVVGVDEAAGDVTDADGSVADAGGVADVWCVVCVVSGWRWWWRQFVWCVVWVFVVCWRFFGAACSDVD